MRRAPTPITGQGKILVRYCRKCSSSQLRRDQCRGMATVRIRPDSSGGKPGITPPSLRKRGAVIHKLSVRRHCIPWSFGASSRPKTTLQSRISIDSSTTFEEYPNNVRKCQLKPSSRQVMSAFVVSVHAYQWSSFRIAARRIPDPGNFGGTNE